MAIPGPDGVIHASYKPSDGKPILLNHDAPTPSGHQRLTWNQEGAEGPPGPPGEGVSGYEIVTASFESEQFATWAGDEGQFNPPIPMFKWPEEVMAVEAPEGKAFVNGWTVLTNTTDDRIVGVGNLKLVGDFLSQSSWGIVVPRYEEFDPVTGKDNSVGVATLTINAIAINI
jgi:hypothetical protein